MLNEVEWCYEIDDMQSFWNNMELKIVNIVDIIEPITKFSNNYVPPRIPPLIKSKINKRNRLLNLRKRNSSNELKCRINVLNFEIKQFYLAQKKKESERAFYQEIVTLNNNEYDAFGNWSINK